MRVCYWCLSWPAHLEMCLVWNRRETLCLDNGQLWQEMSLNGNLMSLGKQNKKELITIINGSREWLLLNASYVINWFCHSVSSKFWPSALCCMIYLNLFRIFAPALTSLLQDNSLRLEPHNSRLCWTVSAWGMHLCCYRQFLHGVLIILP